MKKSKLSESQIIAMIKEGDAGVPVEDICRKYNLGKSTYYKFRSKYTGMEVSDLKRLRALEEENRKLKAMYADISLDYRVLKDIVEKKL